MKYMKRALLLMVIFFILHNVSYSQNADTSLLQMYNDTILKKIFEFIPKGWAISVNNDQLVFERADSVLILTEDRYNDQNLKKTKFEKTERIKSLGKKGKSRIVLRFENIWSPEKILAGKNVASFIYQDLKKLPAKYGITNLYDTTLSTRENSVYTGVSEKEKKQVEKYEKAKKELLLNFVQLPNFNTEKYSFFITSKSGFNDNTHSIYPEEASSELYQILTIFVEYSKR